MDYRFDEDQESFRVEVRRWAEKVLAPHYQSDDRAARFRPQLARDMAAMGLTSLRIPAEHGGQAASAVIAGIAAEEVGRADFNAGYVIINTALISDIVVRNATAEQRATWLPSFATGETVPCICITEPGHGTDAANLEMKAVPDADGWRLHGEKTSITLGMAATHAVVLARTGARARAGSRRSGSTSATNGSAGRPSTTSDARTHPDLRPTRTRPNGATPWGSSTRRSRSSPVPGRGSVGPSRPSSPMRARRWS